MIRFTIITIATSLLLFSASAVAVGPAAENDRAVIEKTVRDSIGWALAKDRPLLESLIIHDESLFIFNPDSEVTSGWDSFKKGFDFWMDPRFKATSMDIRDMRVNISPSGDTAWWSCVLDDLCEWDGRPIGWKDTRWTGVLQKREGKWIIVQMHFSFASDKVIAEARDKLQARGSEALKAGLDFIEGWYDGNEAKVERVLHRDFVRRFLIVNAAKEKLVRSEDRAGFLKAVRRGGGKAVPVDQRRIKATVRDITDNTAIIRVDSESRVEYLNLVKLDSGWRITSALAEDK